MKTLMSLLAVFGLSAAAAAATPQIKITSWQAVGNNYNLQLGEVCGVISGATANPVLLEVVADYNTNNPASYHTFAGNNGAFCQVVRTIYGTVQVNVMNTTPGAVATAKLK